MPALYGFTGNANVAVGNTVGLYQQNTGVTQVLTTAQTLLSLLSNAGTVGFSLTNASTQVQADVDPSGVSAGTYGSTTLIPVVTVGADGRVTTVTTVTAAGGSTYSNANVAAYLPVYGGVINSGTIFNDSGFAIQGRDYTQMQYTNGVTPPVSEYDIGVGAWFYIDAGGGVFQSNTTGTLRTITFGHNASINAGGNITAPYFIGDGSQLTNLPIPVGTYSNTNVAAYLTTATISTTGNITAANLTTTGNVTASYVKGDGSLLTNLPAQAGTYSNTNVTAYLTTATISTTGNITAANLITSGNVYGSYVIGNGSLLTNLPAQAGTYSNANVASYMPVFGGNILAGNIDIPYTAGTRNRGPLAIGGNLNHYDSGVVASFQGNEATYLYTSLQNTNTGNTAYSSYAVNDATHTYYGELGINSGTYDYAAAGYPNNAFSLPYATFIQSTGANLAIGTYDNNAISFLVNGQTNTADAMTIANTGNVTVTGNLAVAILATVGNIKSTNGYFWSNGVAYSTGSAAASFSGDLLGNTLVDSVNGRVLVNASPFSSPSTSASLWTNLNNNNPVYVSGVLQPAALVTGGTTSAPYFVAAVQQTNANIALQSSYQTSTARFTSGRVDYTQVWPVTANTMATGDRWRGTSTISEVMLNNATWGTSVSQLSAAAATAFNTLNIIGSGTMGPVAGLQNTTYISPNGTAAGSGLVANISYVTGINGSIQFLTTYGATNTANVTYARGFVPVVIVGSSNHVITNAVGYHIPSGWVTAPGGNGAGITNRYAVLNEDANSLITTAANVVFSNSAKGIVFGDGSSMITAPIIVAGTNVTISPVSGTGVVTVNANTQAGTYSNTNVTAYLTTATISTTGNITAANLITSGNVYASYVIGDGSLLTNLPVGTYSNANVASYLPTSTVNFGGNIATVSGNTTIIAQSNVVDMSVNTGGLVLPTGGNSARPTTSAAGTIRFNTDRYNPEWYDATDNLWKLFSQAYTPPPSAYNARYLVVAGGGSGGYGAPGGGGAGGFLTGNVNLTPGTTYTLTVGAGGTFPGGAGNGNDGLNSSISGVSITATGGGGGGAGVPNTFANNGGSGGGAGENSGIAYRGLGTSGQGNDGGYGNGGGGGAGAIGQPGYGTGTTNSANGGDGLQSDITATPTYYAGGGAGYAYPLGGASGGQGGGGNNIYPSSPNTAGTANTGGGGSADPNGAGGSGVVILRVATAVYTGTTTGSPTITTSGSDTIIKFTASGSYTA